MVRTLFMVRTLTLPEKPALPEKFKEYLLESAGAEMTPRILEALVRDKQPVSIRINPLKLKGKGAAEVIFGDNILEPIPWCPDGYYLKERPVFTLDPALHAGAYYVQEPSSMFLSVLEPVFNIINPTVLLDLCAAPGGKTTHMISMIPRSSSDPDEIMGNGPLIIANEVIKSRVATLKENVLKWGDHSVVVTNRDARDFSMGKISPNKFSTENYSPNDSTYSFDFILVDAPCSGEGLFRKDPSAIAEWSEESVKMCAARQKRILADIWDSLKPGGLLAYSTCTFNIYENDGNVAWLKNEYKAQTFDLFGFYKSNFIDNKFNPELVKEWGIMPTKEGGFQFFPGLVKGEGFFFALLQKPLSNKSQNFITGNNYTGIVNPVNPVKPVNSVKQVKSVKHESIQPEHEYSLSIRYAGEWPSVELNKEDALLYLSRNSLKLEGAPLGYLRVTYNGLGLGFVKNLGTRANNLYPMNWRIRMDISAAAVLSAQGIRGTH